MMNSRDFDARWLEERITSFPEGVFLDFKKQPPISDKKDDEKLGFAKHLIAFGNVARSTGCECHIIFGVDDETRQTEDLRDFYHPSDLIKWNENTPIHIKQADGIEAKIRQIAENWIKPTTPSFLLKYGEIQDGVFLSYLVIYPTYTSVPFSLSKSYKSFSPGTVFVRVCSSSVPIVSSEVKNLLPRSEVEYLSRSEWQRFFQYHCSGEFFKSQNLLPTFKHKTKEREDALEAVVDAIHKGKKTILIKGIAGIGKSTLLQRVAFQLSNSVYLPDEISRNHLGDGVGKLDEETFIVSSFKDEMSNLPKSRVPIYMSLRTTFHGVEELNKHLLIEIQKSVGKNFKELEGFLRNEGVSWVILLDGVDEIRNRQLAGPILGEWLRLLPGNVQVVLTSRPYASHDDIASVVIELASLKSDEIVYLVDGKIKASLLFKDDKTAEKIKSSAKVILDFIQSRPEFLEFLDRHRAIDGFLEYLGIPVEPLILSDAPRVSVNSQEMGISEESTDVPPVLGDQFQSDDYFPENNSSKDQDSDESDFVPQHRLVEMLFVVYEHLKAAEIIRQREWGNESQKESDEAAYQLSRSAWQGIWRENELNVEKSVLDDAFLDWNQFAGFIDRKKMPRYKYCCDLFQKFLIAEYGYENKSYEMSFAIQANGGVIDNSVSKVIQLYNEICEWRGQKALLILQ